MAPSNVPTCDLAWYLRLLKMSRARVMSGKLAVQ